MVDVALLLEGMALGENGHLFSTSMLISCLRDGVDGCCLNLAMLPVDDLSS